MSENEEFTPHHLLSNPLLPLVQLLPMLYLATPHQTIAALLAELTDPIELPHGVYENPDQLLAPHLDLLEQLALLKSEAAAYPLIVDENGDELGPFEALPLWVAQAILERELETINSHLCGPCHCNLCCIGPASKALHSFFEIPLELHEKDHFHLPTVNTTATSQTTPYADNIHSLLDDFPPQEPTLYHWQSGWSLILPKSSRCPHLAPQDQRCRIYPDRPQVCRKPQIFAYLLERTPAFDQGSLRPAFQKQEKLLAIWDCPYVRANKDQIIAYAEACGLQLIFKENKQ